MSLQPEVLVVQIEFGPSPLAASLNREIEPGSQLLRAALDIRWNEPDPVLALRRIERRLLDISPTFMSHRCRGPIAYHVFVRRPNGAAAGPDPPAVPEGEAQPFDACLALAHLIEHAIIDFESAVTEEARVSGVTGARRTPPGRFDVMVECDDQRVGRLCLTLAVATLTAAAGPPSGRPERDALAAVRLAHRHPGRTWTPGAVARALGWTFPRAVRALSSLRDLGYLTELPYTVNISGVPQYRVSAC